MNMPKFGLGTFRLQGQQVIDSVLTSLDVSYRHIDTALQPSLCGPEKVGLGTRAHRAIKQLKRS